jgi:raffinose/stachyose/melibiose transport system substrate-binding protein
MKKVVKASLILAIILVSTSTVFAGGQQDSSGQKESKKKLVIWDIQTANGSMKEMIDEAAAQFSEDQGVEMEVVHIENENYKTKINIALNSYPPDIFHNWGGGGLKSQVDAGLVEPITDVADQLKDRYIPSSFDHMTFDDQIYGVSYSGMASV